MSNFWSFWIIALVSINIFGCVWLLMWTRRMDPSSQAEDGTTGHEYDGIREYNNPLPSWWLTMFWLLILFGLGYLALYPGLGKYPGLLGWTSHGEVAQDEKAYQQQYGALYAGYAKTPIEQLAKDPRAMQIGGRLFANNCAACHGTDAKGAKGYPNLTDTDWLYGGTPDKITETIANGRHGVMPAWHDTLGEEGVKQVANYVLSLSGHKHDSQLAKAGTDIFASKCSVCHGATGEGNPLMGAPRLNDNIWLYGGSESTVIKTISDGRGGQMPAWKDTLGSERVHLLAAYVWSLSNTGK
jgi:cytochrome c oxidase cbb3-type subunit 3